MRNELEKFDKEIRAFDCSTPNAVYELKKLCLNNISILMGVEFVETRKCVNGSCKKIQRVRKRVANDEELW